MATHSSVLAWRIPGMGEPGGLGSVGSHRVGHDWSDLAATAVTVRINWDNMKSIKVSGTSQGILVCLVSKRIPWKEAGTRMELDSYLIVNSIGWTLSHVTFFPLKDWETSPFKFAIVEVSWISVSITNANFEYKWNKGFYSTLIRWLLIRKL